jgi:hypothetical protein
MTGTYLKSNSPCSSGVAVDLWPVRSSERTVVLAPTGIADNRDEGLRCAALAVSRRCGGRCPIE